MSAGKRPTYLGAGYAPAGPGRIRCRCGVSLSSNALARASHERGEAHQAWVEERRRRDLLRVPPKST